MVPVTDIDFNKGPFFLNINLIFFHSIFKTHLKGTKDFCNLKL